MTNIPDFYAERARLQSTEGFVQYMLVSLIMGDKPPGWNTPHSPSPLGMRFITDFMSTFYGVSISEAPAVYWEFKLNKNQRIGENKWPDFVFKWSSRMLVAELKTQPGSVREGQVDEQIELSKHNFAEDHIHMAYITKDTIQDVPNNLDKAEYKNIIWKELSKMIRSAWRSGEPPELKSSSLLADYIDSNFKIDGLKAGAMEVVSKNEHILQILREVEATQEQKAFNIPCDSPNEAYREKEQIVLMLAQNKIVHAKPWVWSTESKGEALSVHGKSSGIEMRASYYKGGTGYVT